MNKAMKQYISSLDARLPQLLHTEAFVSNIKKHAFLLIFIFLSGFLAYAYDIFQFSLHIDSEIDAFRKGPHPYIWISEGRWGLYLINAMLLPDPVLAVIPTLVAILGTGTGIFFFVKTLSPQRSMADYLVAMIALGCPILYFAFYWQTLSYALGIGLAVVNIGMYYLTRWTRTGFIIASLCFCFGIGTYQAISPAIAVIYGIYFINYLLENPHTSCRQHILHTMYFGFALVIAFALYKLITPITLLFYHLSYHAEYLNTFYKFELTKEYFINYLPLSLKATLNYYTGSKDYYLYELTPLALLFYFSLIIVGFRIVTSNSKPGVKLLGLMALLVTLITPTSMLMMNAGDIPVRTMFAVIFVLAGLVFIACHTTSNIVKYTLCVLAISCYVKFVIINHRYALSSQLTWQADREFSVMLLDRINQVYYKLPPREKMLDEKLGISTKRYPLEIVGEREHYSESPVFMEREAIGASFYNWAPDEVRRRVALFGVMGNFDFWPANRTERRSIIGQALNMPSWPAAGSVDVINGVVVVKFGNYIPDQLSTLCLEVNDDNPSCQKLRARPTNSP